MIYYLQNKLFAIVLVAIWFGFLLISLFPDFFPLMHGSFAIQRFLLSIAICISTVICLLIHGFKLKPFFLCLPFIVTLTISSISYYVNPFVWVESIFYCMFLLSVVYLSISFAKSFDQLSLIKVSVFLIIVMCFFYACLIVLNYVFSLGENLQTFDQVIPPGFVNIRYWSHLATWLLPIFPLGVLLNDFPKTILWKIIVFFTAIVWWWIAIYLMSRGTFFSLIFSFILLFYFFGKLIASWFRLFILMFLLGLVCWFILSIIVPEFVLGGEKVLLGLNTSTSGRWPLWVESFEMSLRNFPFGMGPQSWLTHEVLTKEYAMSFKFAHPHNMYLMWAAEYGWLSILSLSVIFLWIYRRLRRVKISIASSRLCKDRELSIIAFSASVFAAFIHANVSAIFIIPASMMVGLGVFSIFGSLLISEIETVDKQLRVSQKFVSVLSVIFILCLSLWWLNQVWRYHQAMEEDLLLDGGAAQQSMTPRFWVYGNFPRADTLKQTE